VPRPTSTARAWTPGGDPCLERFPAARHARAGRIADIMECRERVVGGIGTSGVPCEGAASLHAAAAARRSCSAGPRPVPRDDAAALDDEAALRPRADRLRAAAAGHEAEAALLARRQAEIAPADQGCCPVVARSRQASSSSSRLRPSRQASSQARSRRSPLPCGFQVSRRLSEAIAARPPRAASLRTGGWRGCPARPR
jgi:hypothetical protein